MCSSWFFDLSLYSHVAIDLLVNANQAFDLECDAFKVRGDGSRDIVRI